MAGKDIQRYGERYNAMKEKPDLRRLGCAAKSCLTHRLQVLVLATASLQDVTQAETLRKRNTSFTRLAITLIVFILTTLYVS